MVEAILIAKITNLFNDDENEIRQNMSFFVKVYHHFTSVLLCAHGRFVVSKSSKALTWEFVTSFSLHYYAIP